MVETHKVEQLLKKTLDASTNIIWNEMKNIRESSDELKKNASRRWIWELIQNASDCTSFGAGIDIKVELLNEKIVFSHNGHPFSYGNLLDLITQISSKQSSEEAKTGKFGTGFISTHLLSEVVLIEGSFLTEDLKYKNMTFEINRSGKTYDDIRSNIKDMLDTLERLTLDSPIDEKKDAYENTEFIYMLQRDDGLATTVSEGFKDLEVTIPFVLAFNNNINSITINSQKFRITETKKGKQGTEILKIENNEGTKCFNILLVNNLEGVSIACPIELQENKSVTFLPISSRIPKLFCDFPLIGTEDFNFPVIINSSSFDVERDRNAIRENNARNKKILDEAIILYKRLLVGCSGKEQYKDVFNICFMKYNRKYQIQKVVLEDLKKYIEKQKIIPVNHLGIYHGYLSFMDANNEKLIRVPVTNNDENRDSFWELVNEYKGHYIPTKQSYKGWGEVFDADMDFIGLSENEFEDKKISTLSNPLKDSNLFNWFNSFYTMWMKDIGTDQVLENALVPNQEGVFVSLTDMSVDTDIDEELIKILDLVGENLSDRLIDKRIVVFNEKIDRIEDNSSVAKKIDRKVTGILSEETLNRKKREHSNQQLFNKLTNWFLENDSEAEVIFENLYDKRMLLSTPEDNLRRYKIAEKIEENNIVYEELDDIINNRQQVLEILSNIDTLNRDEIIHLLKHIPNYSPDGKEYVDGLIDRSIENVYEYLKRNLSYLIPSTLQEWIDSRFSRTVFPVQQNGEDIRVIIRPSDNNKIIFYEDEELEALDDTKYELWTDNGSTQRIITLGDILKTTGITKIPLND